MVTRAQKSLAAEATAELAEIENTVESLSGSPDEIERQANCLVDWAKGKNVLLSTDYTVSLEKHEAVTTEHEVYRRDSDHRVVKCTKPGAFGYINDQINGKARRATPLNYLRRLELMNEVFDDDSILEGVSLWCPNFQSKAKKLAYVVISQKMIAASDEKSPYPSETEVLDFMQSLGFRRTDSSNYQWFREFDGVLVSDAKPANFIKSSDGLFPIDLLITRIEKPLHCR